MSPPIGTGLRASLVSSAGCDTGPDWGVPRMRAPACARDRGPCHVLACKEQSHEHHHDRRRHRDLLQGLGRRPGRHAFARLAAERRRVGRAAAVPRRARLPGHRARPPRPRPFQPAVGGQRHERLRRRSRRPDRGARPARRHGRRPLHRGRRGRALHRATRNRARREGRPDLCGTAEPREVRGEPRRSADGGVRRSARRHVQGSLAVLPGPRDPVLRREPARRRRLARRARPVLGMEYAIRPQELVRVRQSPVRDRLHERPRAASMSRRC